mmetsp:Transcript_18832/g.38204  ORF Transcript_18832/g.38204 Transcript_18832/m.38204 type:complete len:234 (+) Transcript_18832:423-1124(+)
MKSIGQTVPLDVNVRNDARDRTHDTEYHEEDGDAEPTPGRVVIVLASVLLLLFRGILGAAPVPVGADPIPVRRGSREAVPHPRGPRGGDGVPKREQTQVPPERLGEISAKSSVGGGHRDIPPLPLERKIPERRAFARGGGGGRERAVLVLGRHPLSRVPRHRQLQLDHVPVPVTDVLPPRVVLARPVRRHLFAHLHEVLAVDAQVAESGTHVRDAGPAHAPRDRQHRSQVVQE